MEWLIGFDPTTVCVALIVVGLTLLWAFMAEREVEYLKSRTEQLKVAVANPQEQRVKKQLSRIHGRFHPRPVKELLLSGEYEALEHLLCGLDHAILSLFESRQCSNFAANGDSCKDEIYQAMNVTVDKKEQPVFLNTSAAMDNPFKQKMQMFYQPPFDENGPSSNYSLVWILKKKPKSIHVLPFVHSYMPTREDDVAAGEATVDSLAQDAKSKIKEGVPYHIANFIAPGAFLTAQGSRPGILSITFQVDEENASEIYFKLGKDSEGKIRYAMRTEKNFYLLPVAMDRSEGQNKMTRVRAEGLNTVVHKIHARQLKVGDSDQTDGFGESLGVPKEAFVWKINDDQFKVKKTCCRPIQRR